ncbi:MAG: hypothetical protein JWP77_2773 [Polaromonas sp.]|jgi:hypothetical protein|nr:hypothetical protein [Polaromonas sp.]MDB5940409.1 hypothetical protein [Polaromonas sp.]
MSNTSIGSGNDSNENHSFDDLPSKTLGAESGSLENDRKPSAEPSHELTQPSPVTTDNSPTEADLVPPEKLLSSGSINISHDNPGEYPDGPNVAPSPWEKDAAQGKG